MSYDWVTAQIKFLQWLHSLYDQSSAWKIGMFLDSCIFLTTSECVCLHNQLPADEFFIRLSSLQIFN